MTDVSTQPVRKPSSEKIFFNQGMLLLGSNHFHKYKNTYHLFACQSINYNFARLSNNNIENIKSLFSLNNVDNGSSTLKQ